MISATNIEATAVNTVGWLSTADATIVVPIYQRQYRWDIGACEQLLADIRAVADLDDTRMHFIGSILSAESRGAGPTEWVLIDGQQRITTLMLLVAALAHTAGTQDAELSADLLRVLVHPGTTETKLRPHRAWAQVFQDVVLGVDRPAAVRDSRFADNYAFFRSQIRPDEVAHLWRGLRKLEHVAITLGQGANAQQIFESLNSTGEPLQDHELIHNYVLMGLTHAEQTQNEDEFWAPIEAHTGEHIATFWNHFLVMVGGREVAVTAGGRGVYEAFRAQYPRLDSASLRAHAARWRDAAQVYGTLLQPERAADRALTEQLVHLNTFGRSMYPLTMRLYGMHLAGDLDRETLVALLDQLQSLLLRRAVVSITTDRLVARLLRSLEAGVDALALGMSRVTPSDDRVRVALKHSPLPHPHYVLTRLSGAATDGAFDVDHVVPAAPGDEWTGDGVRSWSEFSEDEQNSLRALSGTLGNLVLLEEPLAEQAFDRSFPAKQRVYSRSSLAVTTAVATVPEWNTSRISERSGSLASRFMEVWSRPGPLVIDDDGLTPILDAIPRRGWPRGWQREFAYVEYVGEHWEVPDIKYLFNRIFKRLWADDRGAVEAFCARRGGPVYPTQAWNGQWDTLDDTHFLYMGWDSRYMLAAVQGVLLSAGIAPEVFVKYSYIGEVM
ncbi:DUF262 domain-containing protein [Microbacterium sediminicola]|uniref:DUF262 domain-containing protein n=1 Tax=Microbacterium sediminicola TaxID=415210 RepID=A0ABN2HTC8_9MICO